MIVRKDMRPLLGAVSLYLALFGLHLILVHRRTHGQQWFTLDDPYIHAAIARNLVRYGTYGISPGVFAAASSSIAWPGLLAVVFAVFGAHIVLLLACNAVLCLLVLAAVHAVWKAFARRPSPALELCTLLLIVLAGPLVLLTFVGMEHVLQVFSVVCLFGSTVRVVQTPAGRPLDAHVAGGLYGSVLLAVLTRFEGAFAVALACILLASNGRWRPACYAAVLGVLPIAGFGWYAVRHGAYLLPNSVLLKAVHGRTLATVSFRLLHPYGLHQGYMPVGCALVLAVAFLRWRMPDAFARPAVQFTSLSVALLLLHVSVAEIGWGYRYESYLVVLEVVSAGLLAAEALALPHLRGERYAAALLLFLASNFLFRMARTEITVEEGAREIYEQQAQVARFLAVSYAGDAVVATDIGMVSFERTTPVIDPFGLGSNQVTHLKMDDRWTAEALARMAAEAHAPVAVLNPEFVALERMPLGWTCVERWTIPNAPSMLYIAGHPVFGPSVYVARRSVFIWATSPDAVPMLRARLAAFDPSLPPGVLARPVTQNTICGSDGSRD